MKKAEEILGKLAALEGVRAVILVSGDGFPMESVIKDDALHADELAAVARDGAAATRQMVAELDGGQFVQGIVEYSKGTVLVTNLPLQISLVLVATRNANKAALWNAAASHFGEVMKAL